MYSSQSKDNSESCLQKYLVTTENLLEKNGKLCYTRSDTGTEFSKFLEVMKTEGTELNLRLLNTSEHRRIA